MWRYVDGCNLYQRMKNRMEVPVVKLIINKVPEKLWTHLTVNLITKLSLVTRKNAILVFCNRFFKMAYFVATTKEIIVEKLVRLFRDNV